ncbi:DUF4181 domain-containing protein [Sporosarcina sp. A2]|uniref:DUF4181 domain-containing protein n=1 Tax=Sporosarcina sp. A2 TaxID=3393449 RepID=UPI003D78D266
MNDFGTTAVLLAVFVIVLFYVTEKIFRRLLGVDSKVALVTRSVNDNHRKIDWPLRAVFIIVLLFLAVIFASDNYTPLLWFYTSLIYLLVSNVTLELIRAYMQKKYSEQKNEYKVTLIQLVLSISLVIIIITTRFFGLIA